jgi:hypothetical protein
MPPRRVPRRSILAPIAVVALAAAACNPVAPTTAPTDAPGGTARPVGEVYAEIRAAVGATRGLAATSEVDPVVIDEAQLRINLEAELDAEYTPEELATTEDILITLGLLPADSSLKALLLDLQSGQVAGYYSPERDELFVVRRSGADVGAVERVTYAHEFTHQLQDQHFDLGRIFAAAENETDGSYGRLALIEGDAVSVQSAWMSDNLTPQELGELIAVALGPASLDALRNAPRYLRETSLFPYEDGFAFVSRLLAEGGYAAVDEAYADPPTTTEQVIHPDRYLERELPDEVFIPAGTAASMGAGWFDAGQDVLGELVLRIWLREGGISLPEARVATAGWGGDRLVLMRGPDDALAVGLITTWDSVTDADEFAAAARTAAGALRSDWELVRDGPQRVSIALGAQAGRLLEALGG